MNDNVQFLKTYIVSSLDQKESNSFLICAKLGAREFISSDAKYSTKLTVKMY